MSVGSTIEWTEATWNPVTGCDWVSPGCDNCYARTLAKRMKAMGNPRYQNDGYDRALKRETPGFKVTLHHDKIEEPLRRRKPTMYFVNSMSDLFHDDVPDQFICDVFDAMRSATQHTFQVLTKRPRRMARVLKECWSGAWRDDPAPNVWVGTSVEDQEWADRRIPLLLQTPATVRFLSCEPLLGPLDLNEYLDGPQQQIHWVIVGGESGLGARPMEINWASEIRDSCRKASTAFFFKQWGGRTPKAGGRELEGRTWDEMPLTRSYTLN